MEKFTAEQFFDGKIKLFQPATGYRYTIDPLLLCSQIALPPAARILDIGCGSAIMPLIIGYRNPDASITGVELQESLAHLAQKNVAENKMADRMQIINHDIAHLGRQDFDRPFDVIVSNPPYKKAGTGRVNPDPQKAIARHELKLTIATLFQRASDLMGSGSQIYIIFPAQRLFDLNAAAMHTRIYPNWIRFIHASSQKPAMRVIFCGIKNRLQSCRVLPPLFLYDSHGSPTKEHKGIFNP